MRTTLAYLLLLLASAGHTVAQVDSSGARHLQVLAEVGADSANAVSFAGSNGTVLFRPDPVLTLDDVTEIAMEQKGGSEGYFVVLRLTDDGSRRLRQETEELIGRRLGVVYAGELMIAPFVQTAVEGPFALNGSPMPLAEAEAVTTDLKTRIDAADPDS
jgi:preprotein translocase subunit SecD